MTNLTIHSSERTLFGTDGIRGIANTWPMDSQAALMAGKAIAAWFKQDQRRHKIVIGKDTRLSGYMIETALASGLVAMGVDVYLVGPLPTPGIAFITSGMRADAGVMISASHNSYEYNGVKIFDRSGFKLDDAAEYQIEQYMKQADSLEKYLACPQKLGKAYRIDDAVGRYVVYLKSSFPRALTLDGLRIVVDCANGATYKVAPEVFSELGADVHPVGVSPNGMNINLGVGSTDTALAQRRVQEIGADLGIALDGDGDRLILIDENGKIVDGDAVLAFVGRHLLEHGKLTNNTVVATVTSNLGLDFAIQSSGGTVERTDVGDRYVAQRMREVGSNFGGESSGHLIFMDESTTGDGTLAALQILQVMQESGKPLSTLASLMEPIPQITKNLSIIRKIPFSEMPEISNLTKKIEQKLKGRGRVLLRYSGTEDLIRILLEGEDKTQLQVYADELTDILQRMLGE
ncbi:phosphoglucosamine mutase-like [Ylistrum balloti]|uniref:phosphoglucosamine mutase-like n=1 Tax=Ylistrum balloti TaxID=509963 RepID=UPI00290588B1|nr:phosphoglucosamine mutase-like [Ylistrum balloti]